MAEGNARIHTLFLRVVKWYVSQPARGAFIMGMLCFAGYICFATPWHVQWVYAKDGEVLAETRRRYSLFRYHEPKTERRDQLRDRLYLDARKVIAKKFSVSDFDFNFDFNEYVRNRIYLDYKQFYLEAGIIWILTIGLSLALSISLGKKDDASMQGPVQKSN